jgi:hypothetical protein
MLSIPLVKCLVRGFGKLALFAPRIETFIDGKMWKSIQRSVNHGGGYLIQLGVAQNIAGGLQYGLLG